MEGLKQFKDLTLVYKCASPFIVKLYTDWPGGTIALRRTLSFPASTGSEERTMKTLPLEDSTTKALLEGKLYKVRAEPTTDLILFEGEIRARPIGEFIVGSLGEIFETQELS